MGNIWLFYVKFLDNPDKTCFSDVSTIFESYFEI